MTVITPREMKIKKAKRRTKIHMAALYLMVFGIFVVMAYQDFSDEMAERRCAQDNNVFECTKHEAWLPSNTDQVLAQLSKKLRK